MFFVTVDHKIYGPYWHKKIAVRVEELILDHFNSIGVHAQRAVEADRLSSARPGSIRVAIVEKHMLHDVDDWKTHCIDNHGISKPDPVREEGTARVLVLGKT